LDFVVSLEDPDAQPNSNNNYYEDEWTQSGHHSLEVFGCVIVRDHLEILDETID
jgi:hypothetical protein